MDYDQDKVDEMVLALLWLTQTGDGRTWKGHDWDAMDRLSTAAQFASTPASTQFAGVSGSWSYDSYGNRTAQSFSNSVNSSWANYNPANNRITTASTAVAGYVYDASGNTLYDGNNEYWYDAEGQLCAVQSLAVAGLPITQYIYDAEGARIGKGTLAAAPASYTATCAPPMSSGYTLTARYLVDLGGDQVTELNTQNGTASVPLGWAHSNVFSAARLTATYDTSGLHYALADPLGTKRIQANISGQIEESCISLPFGDALNCTPTALATADDATEHHFTQKERDNESNNDYFFARYYNSALGRFTTPDWSAKTDPVPYAVFDDPQSLNLYAYVRNNPITHVDLDGHECKSGQVACIAMEKLHRAEGLVDNATEIAINTFMPPMMTPFQSPAPPAAATLTTNRADNTTTFSAHHGHKRTTVTIETHVEVDSEYKKHHPNVGGPFSSFVAGVRFDNHGGTNPSYGPNGAYIDVDPINQENIHGGGIRYGMSGAFRDYQGWDATYGCTRGQNLPLKGMGIVINNFQLTNPGIPIWYTRE